MASSILAYLATANCYKVADYYRLWLFMTNLVKIIMKGIDNLD
jgi:hypothetical protein